MKLEFSKIKKNAIFEPEYQSLNAKNGTIEFKKKSSSGGIAVVYAPNGTGKSSLTKVLSSENSSEQIAFVATDEKGSLITPESNMFHIIPDQINRNVIKGTETDYLIGKQIRREYELRDSIDSDFEMAFTTLTKEFKEKYKVSRVADYLLTEISKDNSESISIGYKYLRSIINTQSHGKDIRQGEFLSYIRKESNRPTLASLDEDKRKWVIDDSEKTKIISMITSLNHAQIIANEETVEIERHDDAIGILKKYHSLQSCVVCDNPSFDGDNLLNKKNENRKRIYDSLDEQTKNLLDKVVKESTLHVSDPFGIRGIVIDFISGGEASHFIQLQEDLSFYVQFIGKEMIDALFHCFDNTDLFKRYDEYELLTQKKPEFDEEELLYIERIISDNIEKEIAIERDSTTRNYKLKLGDKNLIGIPRNDMELSAGEQNFISLAFELLLARHSSKQYVVLDDPISSFDSVYKNKIAYCIIRFLEDKKQIVLTHNTDLIRLLEVQVNGCFNLYIMNNTERGQNGFLPVSKKERDLLINLHKLIGFFQNKDYELTRVLKNRRQFLMAMIPFMRGYAHISRDPKDYYGTLSGIMHGYATGTVDVTPIYRELFGYDFQTSEEVSVEDVLNIMGTKFDILDEEQYPLLSNTLEQTLIYYYLRMKVENVIVDSFKIKAGPMDTLSQIITRAFNSNPSDPYFAQKREFRVFFTSRKTLLNEFNHFEGNMNIYQPAIDINPSSLKKEIDEIEAKLIAVKQFATTLANGS